MTVQPALTAVAWSLAAANIWAYGRSLLLGSCSGMACASSFLALSVINGDAFMGAANCVFLILHVVNYRKARALINAPRDNRES